MKRSEINAIMKDALKLFNEYKISLPPFAKWTPEEWKQKGEETQEIKDNMLGFHQEEPHMGQMLPAWL